MLKIYYQDRGWAGLTIVVSDSLENATKLILEDMWADKDLKFYPIKTMDIELGAIISNSGDQ